MLNNIIILIIDFNSCKLYGSCDRDRAGVAASQALVDPFIPPLISQNIESIYILIAIYTLHITGSVQY